MPWLFRGAREEVITLQSRPAARENIKITRLRPTGQTALALPEVHTNVETLASANPSPRGVLTCAAIKEIEPYLVGKDPRNVVHHWQAIYRHAFYRGGPILTSALSGVDQALWDIKGKILGVPVYELLGGPTRQRIRVYAHAGTPDAIRERKSQGFTAQNGPRAPERPPGTAIENRA
jgi:galactonate dehydratase